MRIRDWRDRLMRQIKTDRKPLTGNSRSHALNATKKKQRLNKQSKKIDGVKFTLTTREWKSSKKAA